MATNQITREQQNQLSMIGAAILDGLHASDSIMRLQPVMFDAGPYRDIFSALRSLAEDKKFIDTVSIENALGTSEYRQLITLAAETVPSLSNVAQYEQFIIEDYRCKLLLDQLTTLIYSGSDANLKCSQLRDILQQQDAIASLTTDASAADFAAVLDSTIANITKPDTFLRLSWDNIDRFGLFERSNTVVLSGRPGTGKTDFALALAARFALRYKVYYLTLEETKEKLMRRIISKATLIDASRIRDNKLSKKDMENIHNAGAILRNQHNMIFDDDQNLTPEGIHAKLLKHKPEVAFIDHIGLVTSSDPRANEYQRITETTRKLKQIAMSMGIVIVELSQLNRTVDKTGGITSAKLGDLRGSGSIEQDANAILFVENTIDPDEHISGADGYKDVAIRIGKNREGSAGRFMMQWQPQYHHWKPSSLDDFTVMEEPLPEIVQQKLY